MATRNTDDSASLGDRFLQVKEVASILGVSSMTLYRMMRQQQFPALRLRTRWIVPAGAVGELTTPSMPPYVALGPGFLDVPLVAHVLRVSPATLYRLIHDGGFPAVWLRGRVLVPGHVVDEMAEAAITARVAIDPKDWVTSPVGGDPSHEHVVAVADARE